jgi:hypothetical protein
MPPGVGAKIKVSFGMIVAYIKLWMSSYLWLSLCLSAYLSDILFACFPISVLRPCYDDSLEGNLIFVFASLSIATHFISNGLLRFWQVCGHFGCNLLSLWWKQISRHKRKKNILDKRMSPNFACI